MQRQQPNEKRLTSLYHSGRTNSKNDRLAIAHIFKQTNFGLGKQSRYLETIHNNLFFIDQSPQVSISQRQYPKYRYSSSDRFNLDKEKDRMRVTNFETGRLDGGHQSCYRQ